ncbi:MAG: hypothetical protein OXJ56_00310 [Rhodospirillaceae bacterium]|nr:hypothetical protein [Rhodospirillaceae bacterium]MDE0363202.1 hypothetical protein [Rhodospirillaceae bacterium]
MFLSIAAVFAEFKAGLIGMRTRESMAITKRRKASRAENSLGCRKRLYHTPKENRIPRNDHTTREVSDVQAFTPFSRAHHGGRIRVRSGRQCSQSRRDHQG